MKLINYEQKDDIVIITLNRPDRLNALSREMIAELGDSWKKYDADPKARVAILTGTGKAFSAGLDVKELGDMGREAEGKSGKSRSIDSDTTGGMFRIKKPIITAINGLALGAGCIMVLESDIRIAAKSATIGMPEVKLGLYGGIDMFIAQSIPLCIAMELSLIGDPITAQRAYEYGLINLVVLDIDLMPEALKMAEKIAKLPPLAVQLNKQVGLKSKELSPKLSLLKEEAFDKLMNSEDSLEALKAFIEKRKPIFKGR